MMVTPLQPREFFQDGWVGEGEFIPHPFLRWLIPRQGLRLSTEPEWLSDTIWLVKDRIEFSSGRVLERKMFCELVAPDRIHCTADDMPLGADILLHDRGFRFTPYYALGAHRDSGRAYRLWCLDECWLDDDGFLHDTIRMYYWRFPVATLRIGPMSRKGGRGAAPGTSPEGERP
jgi:hypothetical protein